MCVLIVADISGIISVSQMTFDVNDDAVDNGLLENYGFVVFRKLSTECIRIDFID